MFGPAIMGPIEDVTPTYLTRGVLETLRICDHLVNRILTEHSMSMNKIHNEIQFNSTHSLTSRCHGLCQSNASDSPPTAL